ncbi:MAG: response regulator [Phormidesmis sp.]
MRILLVEDDESVAQVLQKLLSAEHYAVDVAGDGYLGWQLVSASHYDLVILDVVLPKLDGLAFCRQLREQSYNVPVLLVTALDSSDKKIDGLDAGADDYITKPFELKELLARVRALLRRSQTSISLVFEWGDLRLDPQGREVSYGTRELSLTPKEYALLELFLRNPSQVFSRRAILDSLWSYSEAPGEETVTSHIKGLRRKLSAAGASSDFVETVYGVGYRLNRAASGASTEPSPKASTEANTEASAEASLLEAQVSAVDQRLSAKSVASADLGDSPDTSKRRQKMTQAALATLWKSVKPNQRERLELLKQMLQQLEASTQDTQLLSETREAAYRAAHSLIGVLGIFGLKEASVLAQKIQDLLGGTSPIKAKQAQLRSHINALETQLNQTVQLSEGTSDTPNTPLLVLADPQLKLIPKLVSALWGKGLTVKVSPHLDALQKLLSAAVSAQANQAPEGYQGVMPDIVLFSCSLQKDADSQQMKQLTALIHQVPSLMVLICSADGTLATRAKASQMGVCPFLFEPSVDGVVRGIEMLRSHPQQTSKKILAVDDDPEILAALRAQLEPQGFEITTLKEPLNFWQALQAASPDLLLLDISMPEFSGIDLCQIVRQAPAWNHLPIVFFTAHTDADTQQAAFRAGADDLVEKSLQGSSLLAHLFDQIKRSHLQQAINVIAEAPPFLVSP